MYIIFACLSSFESDLVTTEVSTFYGIRYNRNGFAVLSTEHSNHDYLLPMDVRHYQRFMAELSSGTEQISGSIGQIEEMSRIVSEESENVSAASQEQSASMYEIADASKTLAAKALELQDNMGKFQI